MHTSISSSSRTPSLTAVSDGDDSSGISSDCPSIDSSSSGAMLKSTTLRETLNLGDIPELVPERPWIVGHRGALYQELENTLAGFQYCIDVGADAVELDVFYIANELIVFHGGGTDQNPGDLTDYCLGEEATGRVITDCTSLAQVQLLQFNPSCPELACPTDKIRAGIIPTLKQVLELIVQQKSNMVVKIELKGEGTVRPVLELVTSMNLQQQCHFASFNHARIRLVRLLHPEVNTNSGTHVYCTGALFHKDVPDDFIQRALTVGASEVHLPYSTCTVERIHAIHAAGMGSMAWFRGPVGMLQDVTTKFVDVGNEDETMYRTVIETGVQQLCCNRPELLAKMLTENKNKAV